MSENTPAPTQDYPEVRFLKEAGLRGEELHRVCLHFGFLTASIFLDDEKMLTPKGLTKQLKTSLGAAETIDAALSVKLYAEFLLHKEIEEIALDAPRQR